MEVSFFKYQRKEEMKDRQRDIGSETDPEQAVSSPGQIGNRSRFIGSEHTCFQRGGLEKKIQCTAAA